MNLINPVGPGKDAGYRVTIFNDGPGNISTLFLRSSSSASYTDNAGCNTGAPLSCTLGALAAGQSIQVIVAIQVPNSAGTFSPVFKISATGSTTSDRGHTSRGDDFSFGTTTTVTTDGGNFDAGFVVGGDTYSTNQSVGRNNVQATKLENAPELTTVSIRDGVTSFACQSTVAECSRLIGEWSVLNVGDGTVGPIKVTVLIYGNAVTGNPDPSELFLVHTNDAGVTNVIDDACTYDVNDLPTNADCLVGATKVGRNYQIVAWLETNGGIRGGY